MAYSTWPRHGPISRTKTGLGSCPSLQSSDRREARGKNIRNDGEWNVLESKGNTNHKTMFSVMSLSQILCRNSKTDCEKLIRQCHVRGRRTYGRSMVFGVRASLGAGSPTSWRFVRLWQVTQVSRASVSISSFRIL